jgi:hypothetical protein
MALILAAPVALLAVPITVGYDNGTTWETTELTGYSTDGAMMDGMEVTAWFSDGSFETLAWADITAASGGVSGSGWSLSEAGDTFGGHWTLQTETATLDRLAINGAPGNTVFDVDEPYVGTAGSARGWTFEEVSSSGFDPATSIEATYIDAVALSGDAPVGDLYRLLDIDFVGGDMGPDAQITFIADTDNLRFAGDITPVPEPSSMLLLGVSLLSLAGFARRRRA